MSDFESPRVREGLPPAYRMRAESHYVDLLEARSTESRESARADSLPEDSVDHEPSAPAGSARPAPSAAQQPVREVAPAPAAFVDPTLHAGGDLARALTTLSACADLLNGSQSELSRGVVGNLVRAEAWRASTLLHGTRVVRRELPLARMAVSVLGVLDQVVQGFSSERRLRPIVIESETELPYGSIVGGDEVLLVGALSNAVLATLALVEQLPHARVVVSAAAEGGQLTFAVRQSVMTPPLQWQMRAFDPHWTDRMGGVPSLVAMLAVRDTAALHGGSASATVEARGTKIAFTVPLGV
ncbi:MAG: hypothetical protein ABL961_11210 [Vicinamibacterales bacterium]